jgi:anaerobic dimethyl sulfoxide reductase subunit A
MTVFLGLVRYRIIYDVMYIIRRRRKESSEPPLNCLPDEPGSPSRGPLRNGLVCGYPSPMLCFNGAPGSNLHYGVARQRDNGMATKEEKIVSTVCSSHCGGICLLKAHVADGRITKIETDNGREPQLRACMKGRAMRQRIYAADRLKYPLKRTGKRREGKFERITWEEALETIASELKRVKETYGPAAILFRSGGGDLGLVHGGGTAMARLLSLFGGYTTTWGSNSWEGATFASAATLGTIHVENGRDDLVHSRLIILWGCDPAITIHSTNTLWYLIQAKEKGAKIVSVDPRLSDGMAVLADRWISPRPTTDAAMLIAMAHVMVKEKLHDREFLDRYTIGFDQYRAYLLGEEDGVPKTAAWAEAITGVPAPAIEALAREYATLRPAALIAGIAAGRTMMGEQYHRAAITLAAMTGNIGVHGGNPGGPSLGNQYPFHPYPFKLGPSMTVPPNEVDQAASDRRIVLKNYTQWRSTARIHSSRLADAILTGKTGGYPSDYKFLYVVNSNPVNQLPNPGKWEKALQKLDFMVVQEQFLTATARFADILLPTSTSFERHDLVAGGTPPFWGYLKKVIEPLYESKSQLDIATALANRLGLRNYNDKTDEMWVREIAKGGDIPDYEVFREKGIHTVELREPFVPLRQQIEDPEHHPFPTPSGKIEIYSEQMANMNDPLIPAVPKYIDFRKANGRVSPERYPLQMVNRKAKRRAHSQLETLPWLKEMGEDDLEISAENGKTRGIETGDKVRVFNDQGSVLLTAKVTERIMPGVVCMAQGAWYAADENGLDRGGCASTLLPEEHSPCGAFVTSGFRVEVERFRE